MDLDGRSLLKVTDLNAEEFLFLVDQSGRLRAEKRQWGDRPTAGGPQHRPDLREDLHPDPVRVRGRRPTTRAGTSPTSARGNPSSATRSR